MNAPVYTLTNESITLIWEGKSYTIRKGATQFNNLRNAILNENWDDVPNHLTVPNSLQSWAKGEITLEKGDQFYYKGKPIPTEINARILEMAGKGEDPTPLFKFWERLKKNPSYRSVEQLYAFIKYRGIPLTPAGTFLAYKSVRHDYKDHHSGTIDNSPGKELEMPRNEISDDPKLECHVGFHVGTMEYATKIMPNGRILVCEIDPENVVCVPYDYRADHSQQKVRVCKYKVLGHHNGELLPTTVFTDDKPEQSDDIVEEEVEEVEEDVEETEPEVDEDDISELECDECDHMGADHAELEHPAGSRHCTMEGCECEEFVKPPKNDAPIDPQEVQLRGEVEKTEEATKAAEKRKSKPGFKKFDKMGMEELLGCSIDELRKYATYGMQIVGASKIPGGKTALVMKILEIRE